MVYQGSLNGTHFGKIKVEAKIYASFEGFPDFPYNGALALFGLVKKNDPWIRKGISLGKTETHKPPTWQFYGSRDLFR